MEERCYTINDWALAQRIFNDPNHPNNQKVSLRINFASRKLSLVYRDEAGKEEILAYLKSLGVEP